jgi:hypothetical protein
MIESVRDEKKQFQLKNSIYNNEKMYFQRYFKTYFEILWEKTIK